MGDPNFDHRIVLMLEQNPEGALGLVINDPIDITLQEFAENHAISCHGDLAHMPVYRGGPVELAAGWILHADESAPEKQEVQPGLFVSGSQETLTHLLENGFKKMRLILGYAGWSPGQLEEEIAQGAWLTTDVNIEHVFETEDDDIWNCVLADMGIDPSQLILGGGMH